MNEKTNLFGSGNRRSFMRAGLTVAGAGVGAGLVARGTKTFAQSTTGSSGSLTAGDAAILRFLAAGEALEADFWTQYNELCGIQDGVVSGGTGSRTYTERVRKIDPNFPQYVHDN